MAELLLEADNYCRQRKLKAIEITVITSRHELIDWYKRRGFYDTGEKRAFPIHPKFGVAKQPFDLTVMNKDVF
ncbi:N-acetyltransferase [Mucilaginibacter ginkgonis]|uniref:Acetyltransferase (GNAT) family protein n=1 Tax=Mucilaginibacter ginkgonis TaxID=2682091 RepID=A0A7T7FBJ9_9SPHI|nr:hypothetical protein [Mucilaginibacter ginkgonis]QQL50357.1 hypothetical protein GO620_002560 [Mucilaginibacter ginkgonis]